MFGRSRQARQQDDAQASPAVLTAFLIARADAARQAGAFRDAASFYKEALRLDPDAAGIAVQCGHMLKEAGEFDAAEHHYLVAARLTPDDADLALQLGHLYKVSGQVRKAASAYRRALLLKPDWPAPADELAALQHHGWVGEAGDGPSSAAAASDPLPVADLSADAAALSTAFDRLVPELVPRQPVDLLVAHAESVSLRRFGVRDRSRWGFAPTFRGVEAIRGFCISRVPIVELQITMNGLLVHRGPLKGGFKLTLERNDHDLLKYVFNVWLDFAPYLPGRYLIELRFIDARRGERVQREHIVVAAPLPPALHPDSDGVIALAEGDDRPVVEQVNALPSVVHPAARTPFQALPRNVLILRTDQLGDMVTSIPAMRRLRELLPAARLVGLLTASNAAFGATLGLFDEIITIEFKDDLIERRRIMPLDDQEALRARLAPYRFDLALDLASSGVSRPLLLLSGAPFLYGFGGSDWPWLSADFLTESHDPQNRIEMVPHSTRVLGLIEQLGAMLSSAARVVRRADLPHDALGAFGLTDRDRFAVFHTGARIAFSRWPSYLELAARLVERTALKVIIVTDDPDLKSRADPRLLQDGRLQILDQRLAFDAFDALLSYCSVFVGNDSGPKHLAALRGVPVVSIHAARVDWREWGQEMGGCVISRRVPCAGCMLYHDVDECGQDYVCVTRISVDEVFDAVMKTIEAGNQDAHVPARDGAGTA